jgi:hypothetical protein
MAPWAAYSGIALAILMAGVLAGILIERTLSERREYDDEIAGYESELLERRQPRHALPPEPGAPELEAPKSEAPPFHVGPVQAAWPRPSRVLIFAAGSQRSRWPLEDTGRMPELTDTGELRSLEAAAAASRLAMVADNARWLEAWSKAAP